MSRFVTRAGEQVAELAELCAEAGRLTRGRALFRKGSVSDLSVAEGLVTASVRGSKGDYYEATIDTAPAPPGVRREVARASNLGWSMDDLIDDGVDVRPREIDLGFSCDCLDWEEPCKHVVAVFLAFADRVDLDEAELLRWRSIDSSDAVGAGPADGESEASSRSSTERRASTKQASAEWREASGAEDRAARLSRLQSLLGDTAVRKPTPSEEEEPPRRPLDPALAEFLGVDADIEPIDVSIIPTAAPLFTSVELGPLADLGPELADAIATIKAALRE